MLVLDLGRPDRLIVAMTTYNFSRSSPGTSCLYTGFIAIVAVYLCVQMMRRLDYNGQAPPASSPSCGGSR